MANYNHPMNKEYEGEPAAESPDYGAPGAAGSKPAGYDVVEAIQGNPFTYSEVGCGHSEDTDGTENP